jgi:hypothetical protein
MTDADEALEGSRSERGTPLVATWARWGLSAGALAAAFVVAVEGYIAFMHSEQTLASFAWLIAIVCVSEGLLVFALLRAEEARVARELRTARTGTDVLRGMMARRRQQMPFLARLFATKLGAAAVLLADGDRSGALDVLATVSPLMQGGRLEKLRELVDADLERATGTSVGLERCVQRLRATPPTGNREADLYRTHVLVKALLEQGDPEGALAVAGELEASKDEEQQLYVTWLRVWFDLDGEDPDGGEDEADASTAEAAPARTWPALGEGQLRLALLSARAHGAEKLVEMLQRRVTRASGIARPESEG